MKKTFCIIFLVSFIFNAYSQVDLNKGEIEQKHYNDTIPYQHKNGKIIIPVDINGDTYSFLFDTGAPFVIYDDIYQKLNIKNSQEVSFGDVNKKSSVKKTITLPKMNVGKMTFLNSAGLVLNKGDSKVIDCFGIDGVIGSNLLRNSIVQIDSKNKILIITDKAKNLSVKRKNSEKIEFDKQKTPTLKITLQKNPNVTDEVIFDSGDDQFYTMSIGSYQLFQENKIKSISKIATAKGSSIFGFLGKKDEQKNILISSENIFINDSHFKNIISTVNTNEDSPSRLGAKLLEYGKVTIDYNKGRFYFEPYENISQDELSKKPWSIEPTMQNDKMVVGLIWDENVKKKINVGDEILKIGNTDYQSMDFCEIVLKPETDKSKNHIDVKLKDVKTGKIKEVKISRIK